MIGTRILKIDLELAKIIEVNVATFSIKLFFCLCVIANCQFLNDGSQMIISGRKGAKARRHII